MKRRQRWACTECGVTLEPPYNAQWLCVEHAKPNPWSNITVGWAVNPAPQEPITREKLDRMFRDAEAARLLEEKEQAERWAWFKKLADEQYRKGRPD